MVFMWVSLVDEDSYSHHTKLLVVMVVRELLAYNDLHWTIIIETTQTWEERLGGQIWNYARDSDNILISLVAN